MKKYKPYTLIVFMVLQLCVTFVFRYKFGKEANEEISVMEQRMTEDGVPANLKRHVATALRGMRSEVSSYVQSTFMQIIFLNCLMLLLVANNGRKEQDSRQGEACDSLFNPSPR
jgi:hypothetical protein